MNIQLEVSLNFLNCFIKFLFRILKKSQVKCLFFVVSASKNQSIFQKTAFLFVEIQILKKGRLLSVVFQLFRGQSIHEKDKKYATLKNIFNPIVSTEKGDTMLLQSLSVSSIEMHAVARLLVALKTSLRAHPAIIKG